MAISTTKKVNTIWQIIHLKQVLKRWKSMSLKPMHILSSSDSASSPSSGSTHHIPSGFLTVYVGQVRMRFLIPTRFLNLPIFTYLLNIAEEEYGFKFNGGIVLPCEVDFFKQVLKLLEKDEKKYGSLEMKEFVKLVREVGFDSSSCKGKESKHFRPKLMPLVHKAS